MNKKENLHTFVIPVYKESPYLESCIINLTKQTVESDIILTTSTASEVTKNMAKKYQLGYFINESGQKGIGNDWNFALFKGNTQYVTIAHQDDIYKPTYTEKVLKKAIKKESLIIFTDYEDIVNNQTRKKSRNAFVKKSLLFPFLVKSSYKSKIIKKSILMLGDPICCPSVTFNMKKLNNFSFSTHYKCALDWIAWLDIAKKKGYFVFVNEKLVSHRIHNESETVVSLQSGIRKKEELEIFKEIWGLVIAKLISKLYSLGHKDNMSS